MDITLKMKQKAEDEIKEKRKEIDYDTRDYSIDYIVEKFREGKFYIPDEYQRVCDFFLNRHTTIAA